MKRFYKDAAAMLDAVGGYGVALDGRRLKTPAKNELILPTRDLAEAIAEEWARQSDKLNPHSMPLFRLAATAIDRIAPDPAPIHKEILGYARHDGICHWATYPAALIECQALAWQPLLDDFASRHGLRFVSNQALQAAQDTALLEGIQHLITPLNAHQLVALYGLTQGSGSFIIAWLVYQDCLDLDKAFAAAVLDELYQAEQWGEDSEARQRRDALRADMEHCARYRQLLAG